MIECTARDPFNNASITESTTEFCRNNGYLSYISIEETTSACTSLLIVVGSHFLTLEADLEVQGPTDYKLYEGVTYTANTGTEINPIYYNRVDQVPIKTTFFENATYCVTSATKLRDRTIGYATTPRSLTTGRHKGTGYFILNPNTNYVLQFTPESTYRVNIDLDVTEFS